MHRRGIGIGAGGGKWTLAAAGAVGAVASAVWGESPVPTFRSTRLEIQYSVPAEAEPLTKVGVWSTLDEGKTWQFLSEDADRKSPAEVEAPREGLVGFFIVLSNRAGESSAPPVGGTAPHVLVIVDTTPPVVQLHPAQEIQSVARRSVRIRWTAIDTRLPPRPIELLFRPLGVEAWSTLSADRLANTGQYDWQTPEDLEGVVELRMTAIDEAGNRAQSEIQRLDLARPRAEQGARWSQNGAGEQRTGGPTPEPVTAQAKQRAERLFVEGLVDRDRGDYRQGVTKLRRAVEIDPFLTDAFAELGGMLAQLGADDRALSAYEIALMQNPRMRSALQGSARVLSRRGDYSGAAQRLRTILRGDPADAEVWLNLGDVAIYQGDEILARECYERAERINPKATETIEQARRRLVLMSEAEGLSAPVTGEGAGRRADAEARP